jgi:hypothetical protein
MIAAAAVKPMTVLRIVLTPLLLEKPQPHDVGNTAVQAALPRAAIGAEAEGRAPSWKPSWSFDVQQLLQPHRENGAHNIETE